MRRILILGCSGAGKSTLARRMGTIMDLPVIHMDREIWQADWTLPRAEDRPAIYRCMIAGDRWIIDGNWDSSLHIRLPVCDTVILLDLSRWRCLARIMKRILMYLPGNGACRPDMAPGCSEQLDWEFIEWVWNFNRDVLPRTLEKLRGLCNDQKFIVLKSPAEVEKLIDALTRDSYIDHS